MNFRFRPDLASPAEPSMSILAPPSIAPPDALASEPPACTVCSIPQRDQPTNLRLAPVIMSTGLSGSPASDSHRLPLSQSIRQPTPDFPTGSSVKETLRPLNLWMQVQIPLNSVDFTSRGAPFQGAHQTCTRVVAFALKRTRISRHNAIKFA
jgi:hypothetical protein